jgi:hypothetical protein
MDATTVYDSWRVDTTAVYDSWHVDTTAGYDSWHVDTTAVYDLWRVDTTAVYDSWRVDATAVYDSWRVNTTAVYDSWHVDTTAVYDSWRVYTTAVYDSWRVHTTAVYDSWRVDPTAGYDSWLLDATVGYDSWCVDTTAGYDFLGLYDQKFKINVGPVLDGYGVTVVFSCKTTRLNRASHVTLRDIQPAGTGTISGSWNSQLTVFATELQREFHPAGAFSITCFKHTSVLTEGNFRKLNLYCKFIRYYACLLFCAIYFNNPYHPFLVSSSRNCNSPKSDMSTDMRRLTTGIRSEKCVVRRFRRANVYLHKPR